MGTGIMRSQPATIQNGQVIPLFGLPAANRSQRIAIWDYKQRRNLVLLFVKDLNCDRCQALLHEIATRYEQYRALNAEVLAIVPESIERLQDFLSHSPIEFPLLSDVDRAVFDRYLQGDVAIGIFITDQFGGLYTHYLVNQTEPLPSSADLEDWLQFIDQRCAECFPSEDLW